MELDLREDVLGRFSEEQEGHVIQIVREILSNIERHSRATAIAILAAESGSDVLIEINDDGLMFDPEAIGTGNGLRNMRGRSLELGGSIEISPRLAGGMVHRLRVPVVVDGVG